MVAFEIADALRPEDEEHPIAYGILAVDAGASNGRPLPRQGKTAHFGLSTKPLNGTVFRLKSLIYKPPPLGVSKVWVWGCWGLLVRCVPFVCHLGTR